MTSKVIFLCFLLWLSMSLTSSVEHGPVDCSMGSRSCESCHAAYPFCYWCDGQCRRYYGKRIAEIECPSSIMYENCVPKGNDKARINEMLRLLSTLKKQHATSLPPEQGHSFDGETYKPETSKTSSSKKARLLRILKLLKMLAALEAKAKNKEKASQEKELGNLRNSLGSENTRKKPFGSEVGGFLKTLPPKIKQNIKTNSDLEALLNFVHQKGPTKSQNEKVDKTLKNMNHVSHVETTAQSTALTKVVVKSVKTSNKGLNNISKEVPKNTGKPSLTVNHSLPIILPTTASRYCELFEEEDECNSDQDCSWCNLLGQCIGRNEKDFKFCVASKKQTQVNDYAGKDTCSGLTSCKSCTSKGKCYWCEKTKSCHTYPFFGFIPHNCPANMWYYKECDVQLAIFIILFPLLMILLSMVIFYFCLRYCYYRKRTLKVQLFEKADLFERRKGKKVYFVGGDEEDDESRSEEIRKKYNLPHEKEPLITP